MLDTPSAGERFHNLSGIRPGDVILMRSDEKDHVAGGAVIEELQRLVGHSNPEWVHVGVCDGEGGIFEAVPREHVRKTQLAHLLRRKGRIHVRRLVGLSSSPEAIQLAVAEHTRPYRMFEPRNAKKLLERLGVSLAIEPNIEQLQHVVCSTFAERVLSSLYGKFVFEGTGLTLPADFASETGAFECVELNPVEPSALGFEAAHPPEPRVG